MYIDKYWDNYIGGSDDSLNLVAFLEDLKKEEIPLSEIFAKIGLDKQNWDFHQTVEYLEFTHSDGVEMDFHFAIDVVTDLAAILLECSVNGSVNLQDLDEYNTPSRRIRITATPEEHDAMNKTLADFAQNPLSYDLHEMMDDEEIQEMARDVESLRKELYEAAGRNRDYHVKAEDVKSLLPDWKGADGCIATNRITVEGCKVGYCYREKPDGDWDSGWRFTAGDESEEYMDDPNNAGIYKLNTICNDDPDIIPLLNTPTPCAFERDENGVFQQIKDWKPDEDEEDPDMDILKQCQKWHENNEHHKIIEALEGIEERTPEMDSQLARAYNNEADHRTPEGRAMLKKAIALLKPHEEYFGGDYYWNFRMGYSYYYLDQEGRALRYFEKALEARPDDEDTMQLIDGCKKGISLPQFSECFRERTEDWWETFAEMEAELRQMMDEDKDHTRGAELVAQMQETLNLVFDEISFEMGFNGEKHELILTPEGDKVKLFELIYFQKHAPKEVLEHWNILVGRQPLPNIGLRTEDGWNISGDDVQIWLEEQGENSFAISAYCEKLLPMLREAEGRVWWMLTTLTDQVLGEISHMWYIDDFNVLEKPNAEQSFLLSQLPDMLKEKGANLSTDPNAYLNSYLGYEMKPNEDPEADWRLDVMAGSTNCVPLINGYLNADNDFMDDLHADGAVAGFFCYSLDTLREKEGTQKIFDFRDKLEEVLTTGDGPEVLTLTGGATGLFCGYVDFIAWDIQTALQMAKKFFEDSDIPWATFHTFRREAGTVNLKTPSEEEQAPELDETLTGMDYIPYTPQNEEAFFQQLEQWNDEDEYTRCIQALNAIPEDQRNYRTAYAMARALENYAILGDHTEVPPNYKGDKALRRAIEMLESVQEEGQDKAQWNMRMAYAYYYGEGDSPYYPADVDDNALRFFGLERYHSNEFQDEAYLFIPFDEDYYQAMAKVIEERFTNWQGQDFDEGTLEPSEVAQAIMEYLDCECTYFPSMKDDDPIMSAHSYAKRESVKEGFVPVLIKADDETLLECLVMNADPKNDADIYEFDLKTVTEYRKKMLSTSVKDGKAVLEELTGQRKEEAEDDDMDWDEEILGEMEGGYENNRFSCYWNSDNDMTYPLILAKIPVKNPWEIFAYLPFGNWNDCPDTPQLMAAAKYWFEQYGAVPAAMSHDELEFLLPAPVPGEKAMDAAVELYSFCPDIIDQGPEDATVGALADVLRQSTVWYLWWD